MKIQVPQTLHPPVCKKSHDLPLTSVNTEEAARSPKRPFAFTALIKQDRPPPDVVEMVSHLAPVGLDPPTQTHHILQCF